MLVVEDFTVLEQGAEVAGDGRVATCPRCGRNGVRESVEGRTEWIHSQESELMSDGLLVTLDCCASEED